MITKKIINNDSQPVRPYSKNLEDPLTNYRNKLQLIPNGNYYR